MRYRKIFGLLTLATAVLMAVGAGASATTLTSPAGTTVTLTTGSGGTHLAGTGIHFMSEEGAVAGTNHVLLHNSVASIQCNSTFELDIESQGAGVTATGALDHLTFDSCTNSWTVTIQNKGELVFHWTSGSNGTLKSTGMTFTAERHTVIGTTTCRYRTNNTHIGTITGGSSATLHIEASIPFHSGGGLCGEGASNMTGKYFTTSALYIDG